MQFIHGKIFLQTGKALRSAKVSFLNEDMDCAIKRLTVSTSGRTSVNRCRKRNGNSFSQDQAKDSPQKLPLEESDNEDSENYRNFSEVSSPKSSRGRRRVGRNKHIFSKIVTKTQDSSVTLSPDVKSSPSTSHMLSPNGSSSNDTLPECRTTVESPAEPDSTVVCDEESTELLEELERSRDPGEELAEEEELEELDMEEDRSREPGEELAEEEEELDMEEERSREPGEELAEEEELEELDMEEERSRELIEEEEDMERSRDEEEEKSREMIEEDDEEEEEELENRQQAPGEDEDEELDLEELEEEEEEEEYFDEVLDESSQETNEVSRYSKVSIL